MNVWDIYILLHFFNGELEFKPKRRYTQWVYTLLWFLNKNADLFGLLSIGIPNSFSQQQIHDGITNSQISISIHYVT